MQLQACLLVAPLWQYFSQWCVSFALQTTPFTACCAPADRRPHHPCSRRSPQHRTTARERPSCSSADGGRQLHPDRHNSMGGSAAARGCGLQPHRVQAGHGAAPASQGLGSASLTADSAWRYRGGGRQHWAYSRFGLVSLPAPGRQGGLQIRPQPQQAVAAARATTLFPLHAGEGVPAGNVPGERADAAMHVLSMFCSPPEPRTFASCITMLTGLINAVTDCLLCRVLGWHQNSDVTTSQG